MRNFIEVNTKINFKAKKFLLDSIKLINIV